MRHFTLLPCLGLLLALCGPGQAAAASTDLQYVILNLDVTPRTTVEVCRVSPASGYTHGENYRMLSCEAFACALRAMEHVEGTGVQGNHILLYDDPKRMTRGITDCWAFDPCGKTDDVQLWTVPCDPR